MSAPAGVETVATVLKRPRASFAGSSETAYLCDTAPAMEMVGMRRLPVMMWVSHLSTMMDPSRGDIHLHGLDAQAISGLPGLLEEPAVIMDTSWTATRTDVVVMLLDAVDSHGNPLVAAIRPDADIPTRRYGPCIPSNTLLSAYGRLDIDDYLRFMRRNRKILFIDGTRLESLARKCPRNISAPLAGLKTDRMLQPSSVVRATDAIGSGDGIVEWQDGRTCIADDLVRGRSFYAPEIGRYLLSPMAGRNEVYMVDAPLDRLESAAADLARRDMPDVSADDVIGGAADCAPVGTTVGILDPKCRIEFSSAVREFSHERWLLASVSASSLSRASRFLLARPGERDREEGLAGLERRAREAFAAGLKCDIGSRARIRVARDER